MRRFVCWEPDNTYAVINPDADALADHVFRAVHTDLPVRMLTGIAGAVQVVRPTQLLEDLLRPTDHVLVPITGESGAGKSHLIRWLNLKLRAAGGAREVIFVPKSQTNLRKIVQSLVDRLPPKEQQPYLEALNQAGGAALSTEAQRTAILNQLQLALVADSGGTDPRADAELESYALDGLRGMFLDPYLRGHFLADQRFAAELAAHVYEKPERYAPKEGRREFTSQDFPWDVRELDKAARGTQDFISWLLNASEPDREVVIDLINRNLDWAIAQCLNMTGDRVIELMLDLRRHLHTRGRELVLLIEDFARLQGLDRALLQAIIEQRPDLCVLRTVFASTSGFFDSVVETVRTRVTCTIDMDARTQDGPVDLEPFVARYLNAVRWGEKALLDQWSEVQSGAVDFDVPSKCIGCPHRDECHRTFGAVDDIGLYPLTPLAIKTMAERADPKYHERFNPREFQKRALRPVALAGVALRGGQFPPASLLEGLGGATMSTLVQEHLRRDDPIHWRRRLTLLELWGGGGEIHNLDPALHATFELSPLQNVTTAAALVLAPSPAPGEPDPVPPLEDERLRELQAWSAKAVHLSSKTVNALRQLIFAALEQHIDWDDWGLSRVAFFSRRGSGRSRSNVFRAEDISFLNQATQPAAGRYTLSIPSNWQDDAERSRVTLALQGLLEADAARNWAFPAGLEKLACLGECLHEWSQSLHQQFKQLGTQAVHDSGPDMAAAAFELRATLQILLNPRLAGASPQDLMVAALTPDTAATADFASPVLNGLVTDLAAHQQDLLEKIGHRYSAQKGGDAGDFMDTARLLPLARDLRSRHLLPAVRAPGPRTRSDPAEPLTALARKWADGARDAFTEEAAARTRLRAQLEADFGNRPGRDSVTRFLQQLSSAAARLGVQGVLNLDAARQRFENLPFEDLTKALASNTTTPNPRDLRSGLGRAIIECEKLLALATDLLTRTEAELAQRLEGEGVDPASKQALVTQLAQDFTQLNTRFTEYHGNLP